MVVTLSASGVGMEIALGEVVTEPATSCPVIVMLLAVVFPGLLLPLLPPQARPASETTAAKTTEGLSQPTDECRMSENLRYA